MRAASAAILPDATFKISDAFKTMNRKISAALVAAALLSSTLCPQGSARAQAPAAGAPRAEGAQSPAWMKDVVTKLEAELTAKHGDSQRERAARGLRQVASFWRAEDGDAAAFEGFVRAHFAGDAATLDTVFARFQHNLEQLSGHMAEIGREFRTQTDLERGAILPLNVGPEFERMATVGNIAPDLWMKKAPVAPVAPEALLDATRKAVAALGPAAKD